MRRIEKKQLSVNRKSQLIRYLMASIVSGVLAVQGTAALLPAKVHAETADVSVRNWYSGSVITVPELKPAWTAKVDNYVMNESNGWQQAARGEVACIAAIIRSGMRMNEKCFFPEAMILFL